MLVFKRKWGYGMFLLANLTGFSRIFVGHHYPGDVLGSIIVAIIAIFIISKGKGLLEPVVRLLIAI
jgi:undecaprenyl-diphosphatase